MQRITHAEKDQTIENFRARLLTANRDLDKADFELTKVRAQATLAESQRDVLMRILGTVFPVAREGDTNLYRGTSPATY